MRKIIFAILMVLFLVVGAQAASDVTLEWDANVEADLAGYKIHYGTAVGVYDTTVDVGNVVLTTVLTLLDGTYYFVATAYDVNGNESGFSNEVSVTLDTVPPGNPQNLRITIVIKTE